MPLRENVPLILLGRLLKDRVEDGWEWGNSYFWEKTKMREAGFCPHLCPALLYHLNCITLSPSPDISQCQHAVLSSILPQPSLHPPSAGSRSYTTLTSKELWFVKSKRWTFTTCLIQTDCLTILSLTFFPTWVSMKPSPKMPPSSSVTSSLSFPWTFTVSYTCVCPQHALLHPQLFSLYTPDPCHQLCWPVYYIIYTCMSRLEFSKLRFIQLPTRYCYRSSACSQPVPPTPVPILNTALHPPRF